MKLKKPNCFPIAHTYSLPVRSVPFTSGLVMCLAFVNKVSIAVDVYVSKKINLLVVRPEKS